MPPYTPHEMSSPTSAGLLEEHPQALFDAVDAAFTGWLAGRMERIVSSSGHRLTEQDTTIVGAAVASAAASVRSSLHGLLATDVDEQRQNPLHVIRAAAVTVTPVLASIGAVQPRRDEFETRAMPDDVYAIGPLAWSDLGEAVHEAGITWGAWKAATVLVRRRAEGKVQ